MYLNYCETILHLYRHHLNTVFEGLILSGFRFAFPAWSGFLSAELIGQINSFLKRAYKYVFQK